MLIDQVNLYHIRIFECVYRTKSMTKAAEQLHITQSGVSQHIKHLEELLGIHLFERVNKKLIPTGEAVKLFQECSQGLNQIESALEALKKNKQELIGTIKLGLPVEFGNKVILPLVAQFCRENKQVDFKIVYDFASNIAKMLTDGLIDLAFVDNYSFDKQIEVQVVYDEILELCCSKKYMKEVPKKLDKNFFESLDYIRYVDDSAVVKMWFTHHYDLPNIKIKARATLMDVQGVAKLIRCNLGVGVLPRYVVQAIETQGEKLTIFSGPKESLINHISLAYLKSRSNSHLIKKAISYFIEKLKS